MNKEKLRKLVIGLVLLVGLSYLLSIGIPDRNNPDSGEIIITKAVHADKNLNFISDIYGSVIEKDNDWSEPIYHGEVIRAVFYKKLESFNDITIFARNNQGLNTIIEVYYRDSSKKITEFPVITGEKYYKVLLTNLEGSHESFDLKIKNLENDNGAYLEFDYIVDPACTVVDDNVIIHGGSPKSTGSQFNVSAQFTCQSGGGTRTAHFDISQDYGTNTSAATSQATTNLTSSCTGQNFKFVSAEFAGSCNNLANIGCTDANSDGTITIDFTNSPVTAIINWTVEVCSQAASQTYDFDVKATSITDGSITFNDFAETRVTENIVPMVNSSINNTSPKFGNVVNISANISDNIALSFCQFISNQSGGAKIFFNKSVSGVGNSCSQNFTIPFIRKNVINYTILVNDTTNNKNQSSHIITVANTPAPQASIVFPTNDRKSNRQPLDLNVTFPAEVDGDVINISYYINGKLNQTQNQLNTTFNASDGTYILNVSLYDNVTGAAFSANVSVNFTIDTINPIINTTLNKSYTNVLGRDVINITANVTDPAGLSIGQIIVNISGYNRYFNFSLNGANTAEFSQNITLNISKNEVVNFTARVNDSAGNFKTNDTIITIANTPAPQASIVFPTNDRKSNRQPLDLNVTFLADPDGDAINISYYINGKLNQTSFVNTTLNASDGTYILNVSLWDGVAGSAFSTNATINFTIDSTNPVVNATLNKSYSNITVNDIINITANATDSVDLSLGQIIVNISGYNRFFNFSLSGATSEFSQNITINVTRGQVINFTSRVNDSAGNFKTNDTIITVANTPPSGFSISYPADNKFTSLQPLGLNVTFSRDPDNDITNISYYINGKLNQTSLTNTTLNASDGTYILNVSISDGVDIHDNLTINFTIDTTLPIANSTLNKSYTNITVNDIINITANATDSVGLSFGQIIVNISGSKRYYNFSLNGAVTATFSQNITISQTRGEVINFSSRINDTAGNFKTNDTIITVANTPPSGFSIIFPTNNSNSSLQPLDLNVTFTNDPDGDTTTVNYYINGKLNDSTTTNTTFNASDGSYLLNVSITDGISHHDNITVNFTVDVTVPTINAIFFTPNSTDDVDPNVFLNFTINVTDITSNVKSVTLQYKQSGAGTFKNATAGFQSGTGLYYANFTPNIADTWNYRVYASDHAGNNDTTNVSSISVENDRTWNRKPGTFSNLACGFSKICTAGNLTINNTGDFTLNFDLSSNFGATSYNDTEPFDLDAKDIRVIEVNLTAGASASESNIVITTDATTANAVPDSETTNFTFTATAGGPVFDITILGAPTEANKSDPGAIYLNVSLKNIGNETAGVTWINWTLPANWLNVSGTNLTKNFSSIEINEIVFHNITVNLSSDASTGTQKVNVSAASNNSASDSATASIVVTETSSSTSTTTTTTTSTGGGSGGGGGGGGGGGSLVEVLIKPEEIEISQTVELVRGYENSFDINVTNTFNDSVLEDLTLQVEGFLSQYLTITPKKITRLEYLQSSSFKVAVAAPAYKAYEEHTLKATVTGLLIRTETLIGEKNITAVSRNPFTLKNYISLIIQEISREDAYASLEQASKLIDEMKQNGFPAGKSLKLMEEAREKLKAGRYKLAQEISSQIESIRKNAFSANSLIQNIKLRISAAENKGLQVEETKKLLNLALAAFEREDFLSAIQRAKDAQLSIVIETKGKFNISKFVIDHWYPIILAFLILLSLSYFLRKQSKLIIISRRLENLQKEEITLNELMQETQEKYYKGKKINTTEYHKAMYGYEKRLSEVTQLIARLRSKRVGIVEISHEIENLEKEDENVIELVKQLQESYYNKRVITRKVYLKRIREYKTRRIEIERAGAILEAKLAKKEMLEELIAKERNDEKKSERNDKRKLIGKNSVNNGGIDFKKQPPISRLKKLLNFKNLFKKKEEYRPDTVKKILSDLMKEKEAKPSFTPIKQVPSKIRADPGKKINISLIKGLIQNAIAAVGKMFGRNAQSGSKKEIISKLKEKFKFAKAKPGEFNHGIIKDKISLQKHGFSPKKQAQKKESLVEPVPDNIIPESHSNTKNNILKHLKEVHKHG